MCAHYTLRADWSSFVRIIRCALIGCFIHYAVFRFRWHFIKDVLSAVCAIVSRDVYFVSAACIRRGLLGFCVIVSGPLDIFVVLNRYGYNLALRVQNIKRQLLRDPGWHVKILKAIHGSWISHASLSVIAGYLASHGVGSLRNHLSSYMNARMPWLQKKWTGKKTALHIPNVGVVPYSRELAGIHPGARRYHIPNELRRVARHPAHIYHKAITHSNVLKSQFGTVPAGMRYRDRHGHLRISGINEA